VPDGVGPARPRHNGALGTQRFVQDVLFSPIYWPWKVVRLERDSLQDFRHRSFSSTVPVSELYHENSKLSPHVLPELVAARVADELRGDLIRRRKAPTAPAPNSVVGSWGPLLARTMGRLDLGLFYAIELRLLVGQQLLIYEPVARTFHVVNELSTASLAAVRVAVRLLAPPFLPAHDGNLLFVVGFFGRNEMLLGPRGYRRTLVEAGRVVHEFVGECGRAGSAVWPVYEFADRAVDAAIDVDGTEVGTVAVFELGEEPHVG